MAETGYVYHDKDGTAYCSVCGAILSIEEADFEQCDCCGGEGIFDEDEECFHDEEPTGLCGAEKGIEFEVLPCT